MPARGCRRRPIYSAMLIIEHARRLIASDQQAGVDDLIRRVAKLYPIDKGLEYVALIGQ